MLRKSARWFMVRLTGLSLQSRLWAALRPDPESDDSAESIDAAFGLARE
jgi:hypothetical protein